MAGTEHERRRFVTRHDVEDAAAANRTILLGERDVVTDEAAQRAMDLGVTVDREGARAARAPATPTSPQRAQSSAQTPSAPAAALAVPSDRLRQAVRAAVVAELGTEPPGLDAVIEKVLRSRAR
jgi:hypothetical protein